MTAWDSTKATISITPNHGAFAAIRGDGSVSVWGVQAGSGVPETSLIANRIGFGVEQIVSASDSFAARLDNGSVVTWGYFMGTAGTGFGLPFIN